MNQFINSRDTIVTEAINGSLRGMGERIARLDGFPHIKVIIRSDWTFDKVALISGGGAGHEPAHMGFVGAGMLTAAVCGEVFASPSVEAVLAGILAVTGAHGCLLIVKNYTGDRLNFGLAAEKARALGLKVEMVIVNDDIALSQHIQARGLAGALFIHKIAGFMSEKGKNLEEVTEFSRSVISLISSVGISIASCTLPGDPKNNRITKGMAELGLGIHGEPGAKSVSFDGAHMAIKLVLSQLKPKIMKGKEYAFLLNNLGGCTPLEMAVLLEEISISKLASQISLMIGPDVLMTSLDMHGFSLSILPLNNEIETAITYPVAPRAWPQVRTLKEPVVVPLPKKLNPKILVASKNPELRKLIERCCLILEEKEQALNHLDSKIGDGDTGSTLVRAARSLRQELDKLPLGDAKEFFEALGDLLSKTMGGSSGALMAIFFSAAGQRMSDSVHWSKALKAGLDRMMDVGGAKVGDRTMIDALAPALDFLAMGKNLYDVAKAAREGADRTKEMPVARAGRAAYLSTRVLNNITDPGAEAIACLFEGVAGETIAKPK